MLNNYVSLAKKAIESFVKNGAIISADEEKSQERAGCFVSIHKTNGELRGCIGTILPTCKNIYSEIINNAIAASRDPRFEPISIDELDKLKISVDVLSSPELIDSPKELDIKKYGVIVKSKDGRTGLLLPDLEGVDSIGQQISIAREKAGIEEAEPIQLFRFKVNRFSEH